MMFATGLTVGYKPSGKGKCWYQKGFLDFETDFRFGKVDPLPGIGTSNRQCFCCSYEPLLLSVSRAMTVTEPISYCYNHTLQDCDG